MAEPGGKAPLLVLNLRIDQSEAESIAIYRLSEADSKIDLFCKKHHITDREAITRVKARLQCSMAEKYPFLRGKDGKPSR